MTHERYYPSEKNLGKDCKFWPGIVDVNNNTLGRAAIGCTFPKMEITGRLSCEGIVDDVCLFLKNGRHPRSLTQAQIDELRFKAPGANNRDLPPGDIY